MKKKDVQLYEVWSEVEVTKASFFHFYIRDLFDSAK